MRHETARNIFNAIRARPYRVSEKPGVPADNCYFKGVELLQRLGTLGYAVRGRVGETEWDGQLIPESILSLYPARFPVTHFYVEADIDGAWRPLDPTFDPGLEPAGFRVADWEGRNAPCFILRKLYTLEESVAYQERWQDPAYAAAYFSESAEFLKQLNRWLDSVRQGG